MKSGAQGSRRQRERMGSGARFSSDRRYLRVGDFRMSDVPETLSTVLGDGTPPRALDVQIVNNRPGGWRRRQGGKDTVCNTEERGREDGEDSVKSPNWPRANSTASWPEREGGRDRGTGAQGERAERCSGRPAKSNCVRELVAC